MTSVLMDVNAYRVRVSKTRKETMAKEAIIFPYIRSLDHSRIKMRRILAKKTDVAKINDGQAIQCAIL